MKTLELKIPPPIVLFFSIMLAYVCSGYLPVIALPSILSDQYWYISGAGGIGIFLSLAGSWEFRKAKTTIHPSKSEARIIEKIFGEEYLQYKKSVKRWL